MNRINKFLVFFIIIVPIVITGIVVFYMTTRDQSPSDSGAAPLNPWGSWVRIRSPHRLLDPNMGTPSSTSISFNLSVRSDVEVFVFVEEGIQPGGGDCTGHAQTNEYVNWSGFVSGSHIDQGLNFCGTRQYPSTTTPYFVSGTQPGQKTINFVHPPIDEQWGSLEVYIEYRTREFVEIPDPVCGNSVLEDGEICDDGNTSNNDQCSSTCQNSCTSPQFWNGTSCITPVVPVCGDGDVEGSEVCDDGNTSNNDFCSSTCLNQCTSPQVWNGTECVTPITPICGNGIREGFEICDDGNILNGDQCSSTCMNECVSPEAWTGTQCDIPVGSNPPTPQDSIPPSSVNPPPSTTPNPAANPPPTFVSGDIDELPNTAIEHNGYYAILGGMLFMISGLILFIYKITTRLD